MSSFDDIYIVSPLYKQRLYSISLATDLLSSADLLTALLIVKCIDYTGIGRKNETEFDIFSTLTNSLEHFISSFYRVCTQAVHNCKQLAYLKLFLGCPK